MEKKLVVLIAFRPADEAFVALTAHHPCHEPNTGSFICTNEKRMNSGTGMNIKKSLISVSKQWWASCFTHLPSSIQFQPFSNAWLADRNMKQNLFEWRSPYSFIHMK